MPCADSSTIWARRHITTEPALRRIVRSSRFPSSSSISRMRTRSAIRRRSQPDAATTGRTLPDEALASDRRALLAGQAAVAVAVGEVDDEADGHPDQEPPPGQAAGVEHQENAGDPGQDRDQRDG